MNAVVKKIFCQHACLEIILAFICVFFKSFGGGGNKR